MPDSQTKPTPKWPCSESPRGDPLTLSVAASRGAQGNDGGYRDVGLVDVDGDGSLDLVSAGSSILVGFCGRAGMPQNGFGLNNAPRFFTSIAFGQGWSLAPGRFNDDSFTDFLVTGAVRASSPDSGVSLVAGGPCDFSDARPIVVGPKTGTRYLSVKSADVNKDGWTDGVLIHREQRELQLYLGGGQFGLAPGPVVHLPVGTVSDIDLKETAENVLVAATSPSENVLLIARIRPKR